MDPLCGWCKDSNIDVQICIEQNADYKGYLF